MIKGVFVVGTKEAIDETKNIPYILNLIIYLAL